jgi:hypothetical protein
LGRCKHEVRASFEEGCDHLLVTISSNIIRC